MKRFLENLLTTEEPNSAKLIRKLVGKIRPGMFRNKRLATRRVEAFTELLRENPPYLEAVQNHLSAVMEGHSLALYAEAGILSNEGFFAELIRKIGHLVLPPAPDTSNIRDSFDYIFYRRHDYVWVMLIPDETLSELFTVLYPADRLRTLEQQTEHRIYDTLEILIHRATAVGLHPEIINRYPKLRRSDNPILTLNRAIIRMVERLREVGIQNVEDGEIERVADRIDECVRLVHQVRNGQHETGASLALTYMLQRLRQHLARIRVFLDILETHDEPDNWKHQITFFKRLVRFENSRYSIRELVFKNVGFLAYQITEHGGKTGEHYITHGRDDYRKMMWSAMGGGLIVGFLSIFKVFAYYLKWSPFGTAFLYSMNYSIGFIGIHLTHSTLATKQPAMTASRIAASLDDRESQEAGMKNLAELCVKTFRSQFVAFMGNIFIAFPVSFLAAYAWYIVTGAHVAGEEKAIHLIEELHPWKSLSLFHAGIAGVCLFLAGIISGYYDNAVVYRKLPDRIYHHPLLQRITPKGLRKRFSNYIGNNLGSLTGNFFLGIMLGSIGTLGYIFGLPIDIRHITFASGNFGLAVAAIGPDIPLDTVAITVVGILLVGFMNFIVSFSLAIFVATQSRRVSFTKSGVLFREIFRHLLTRPLDFLVPPKRRDDDHPPVEGAEIEQLQNDEEDENGAAQKDGDANEKRDSH